MYYPRKYKKRAPVRKRRYVRRPVKSIRKKRLVKTIQKVINKNAETKLANFNTGSSLLFFNSGITSTGDMRQVMPNIARGSADNERIGDQLRGQKLNIKGYVRLDIANVTGTPLQTVLCRLMVVSLKTKPNFTEATSSATPLNSLLKRGGTTTPFQGFINDINADINTEVWTKHADRKFYLNQDFLVTAAGASTVKDTIKFFNINVPCKKLMKYDDSISSSLLPTNFGPIILLGYCFLDGTVPDTTSVRVQMYYDSDFYYQDI